MDDEPSVAVQDGAYVLSFEWCVAFVIDATNCYYARKTVHPVIAHSRAVSYLIPINTRLCCRDENARNPWHCRWLLPSLVQPYYSMGKYGGGSAEADPVHVHDNRKFCIEDRLNRAQYIKHNFEYTCFER